MCVCVCVNIVFFSLFLEIKVVLARFKTACKKKKEAVVKTLRLTTEVFVLDALLALFRTALCINVKRYV